MKSIIVTNKDVTVSAPTVISNAVTSDFARPGSFAWQPTNTTSAPAKILSEKVSSSTPSFVVRKK